MPSKKEYYNPNIPSQSNKHWLAWLQKELILHDVLAQTPELPLPFEPEYSKWHSVFNQFTIDEETMLIGHSCGAGFLVRWLSENSQKVGKVALVAPFLDPNHNEVKSDFFDFSIKEHLSRQTFETCIFYSTDDHASIRTSVEQIVTADPTIKEKTFNDKGHFTFNDMKTEEFPELRDFLLK